MTSKAAVYFIPETCGQIVMTPINVDCLSDEELAQLVDHPAVHICVRRYARLVLLARIHRRNGDIEGAVRIEQKMERIYERDIPKALRW